MTLLTPPLLVRAGLALLFVLGLYCWYDLSGQYTALGSDFLQDYVAGYNLRHGRTIYGDGITETAQRLLGFRGFENFHPPFLALPFALLSIVPYQQAHLVLNLLSLAAYVAVLVLLVRELKLPQALLWYLLPLGLFWHPFIEITALGQTSMLIAALVLIAWVLLRRSRSYLAGACLGAACLMKLFPGLLVLYLLFTRNLRALAAWAAVVLGGGALTLLLVGPQDMYRYVNDIAPRDAAFWSMFPANVSLRGTLLPLVKGGLWTQPLVECAACASFLVPAAQLALALVLACWSARLARDAAGADAAYALLVIGCILLSPIAWTHNLVLTLLPLLLMLKAKSESAQVSALPLIIAAALFALPTYDLLRSLQALQHSPKLAPEMFVLTRGGFVGLLILLGWFSPYALFRRRRRLQAHTPTP